MQDNLLTISGSRERVQFNEGGCTTRQDEKVVLMSVVDVDFNVYDFYEVQIHTPAEHTIDNQPYQIEVQTIGYTEDQTMNLVLSWVGNIQSNLKDTTFFDPINLMDLPDVDHPLKSLINLSNKPFNLKNLLLDSDS